MAKGGHGDGHPMALRRVYALAAGRTRNERTRQCTRLPVTSFGHQYRSQLTAYRVRRSCLCTRAASASAPRAKPSTAFAWFHACKRTPDDALFSTAAAAASPTAATISTPTSATTGSNTSIAQAFGQQLQSRTWKGHLLQPQTRQKQCTSPTRADSPPATPPI